MVKWLNGWHFVDFQCSSSERVEDFFSFFFLGKFTILHDHSFNCQVDIPIQFIIIMTIPIPIIYIPILIPILIPIPIKKIIWCYKPYSVLNKKQDCYINKIN